MICSGTIDRSQLIIIGSRDHSGSCRARCNSQLSTKPEKERVSCALNVLQSKDRIGPGSGRSPGHSGLLRSIPEQVCEHYKLRLGLWGWVLCQRGLCGTRRGYIRQFILKFGKPWHLSCLWWPDLLFRWRVG